LQSSPERGESLDTRLVDAGGLVTSHDDALRPNPAFPAELQPRDRSRAALETQIPRIESAINPELLAGRVLRARATSP
jgi:hypothetical protein